MASVQIKIYLGIQIHRRRSKWNMEREAFMDMVAIVSNPAEHTLQFISNDGKLVNLAGIKLVQADDGESELVLAIYDDPDDLEPTAYAKISQQQLAQLQQPFKGVSQAVGVPASSY